MQNKHSFFLTFWTICFQGSPYCICIFQLLYFNCFVFLLCDAAQCIGGMGQWCCTKASNGSENVGHGVIGDQCVTVPKLLNDTDTDTFIRYQIFSIPIPVLFSVPNISDTGSDTNKKNENSRYRYLYGTDTHHKSYKFLNFGNKNKGFSSETFSGTKFFRYRFRDFFPVPNFSDTGSETFFRYQFFPIPVPITPKK